MGIFQRSLLEEGASQLCKEVGEGCRAADGRLLSVEKRGNGNTLSSHSKNKKTLKAGIIEVKSVWTKSFQLASAAEEEEHGEEEDDVEE